MLSFNLWPFFFNLWPFCSRVSIQRYSTFLYLPTPPRNVKGTNFGVSFARVTEKETIKRWQIVKETANPSSGKKTTAARLIGLKGMPKGKTLVGPLLQPRDQRDTRKRRKNSAYTPNFVDKPNETIKYIWQSRQPCLLLPFL